MTNKWIRQYKRIMLKCWFQKAKSRLFACILGECWSGTKAASRYNQYGSSEECIDLRQQPCDEGSVGECAGEQHSNYVYRIVISQGELSEQGPNAPGGWGRGGGGGMGGGRGGGVLQISRDGDDRTQNWGFFLGLKFFDSWIFFVCVFLELI